MIVTFGLAFLAGLASFLSPCIFPLIPAYVSYLGGKGLSASHTGEQSNKWRIFTHGVAFVLGFSFVFIVVGITFSILGRFIFEARQWVARIGGVLIVIFGLHLTGLMRLHFLDFDTRPRTRLDHTRSYLSSFLMGIFFSAGWSPCVGPVLSAIYIITLQEGEVLRGAGYLASYSLGLGIPFLIAAMAIGWFSSLVIRFRKIVRVVEVVTGVVLIVLGTMLVFGWFEKLAQLGWSVNFGL